MIQRNTWKPDTCDCHIEYEWDDTLSENDRVHTVSKIIKACSLHDHHVNKENHYNDVLAENTSKNKAIGLLTKSIPKLDGGQNEVKWRFDIDRNVVLSHPLLNKQDKDKMNAMDKSDISKLVIFE